MPSGWLSLAPLEAPQLGSEKEVGNLQQNFFGDFSESIIGDSLVGRCRGWGKSAPLTLALHAPFYFWGWCSYLLSSESESKRVDK